MIAIMSAFFILLADLLKLQQYMLLMPKAVFEGFTLSVAIIIGLGQLNFAFGLSPAKRHPNFILNVWESLQLLPSAHLSSYGIFLPTFFLLWVLCRQFPRVPWMCIIPLLTLPLGYMSETGVVAWSLPTLLSTYGHLHTTPLVLPKWQVLGHFSSGDWVDFVVAGISVALVAVLETLICAKIALFRGSGTVSQRFWHSFVLPSFLALYY